MVSQKNNYILLFSATPLEQLQCHWESQLILRFSASHLAANQMHKGHKHSMVDGKDFSSGACFLAFTVLEYHYEKTVARTDQKITFFMQRIKVTFKFPNMLQLQVCYEFLQNSAFPYAFPVVSHPDTQCAARRLGVTLSFECTNMLISTTF